MKTLTLSAIATIVLLLAACSKDDKHPLSAASGSSTYDSLNTCAFNSGNPGTLFAFQINLETAPTVTIGAIEFDLEWSNGDESKDIYEDDFTINGSTVEFDWCFRFGSTDWFEVRPTILDENDKTLSNTIKIRVNKPAGAN